MLLTSLIISVIVLLVIRMSKKRVYSFRLKPEVHKAIKVEAANKGMSMTRWLEEVVRKELGLKEEETTR